MMPTNITELKQRVIDLENENDFLRSMLDSFWTGNIPEEATLQHAILAQYGRKRLEAKAKNAALLVKTETNLT